MRGFTEKKLMRLDGRNKGSKKKPWIPDPVGNDRRS
jgi:hypothetical protein